MHAPRSDNCLHEYKFGTAVVPQVEIFDILFGMLVDSVTELCDGLLVFYLVLLDVYLELLLLGVYPVSKRRRKRKKYGAAIAPTAIDNCLKKQEQTSFRISWFVNVNKKTLTEAKFKLKAVFLS